MKMTPTAMKKIVEAVLFAAAKPMSIAQLQALFDELEKPAQMDIETALFALQKESAKRSVRLVEVASGWHFQVAQEYSPWVSKLWEEKPPRYSRATLETLALVAYRQPITRGEIEDIRGVAVSSQIIKTLTERNWIKVIGHKDVPGRPAMYATTREFLDYFNLRSLDQLPTLAQLRDFDSVSQSVDALLDEKIENTLNDAEPSALAEEYT